jgi:aldehyde:ferredoxin oxidoreductase
MFGGYVNRVAWVNLSDGTVEYKSIAEEDARKYIGGRGLGVKYVFDNGPEVDPLSPDNMLCFMTGPLTGTDTKMSGRIAVVTKSPLTGTVVDSHHGGWSGVRLKWAGLDGIVFKGKAAKPTSVFVENGEVKLEDASELWGQGVHDTIKAMQDKYGQKDLSVMAIGPAGENLARFACIINEMDRASGRGGTGCVAGSKNLKCIVVRGNHDNRPRPVNKAGFQEADKRALATIMDEANVTAPRKGGLSVYGTNVLMNIADGIGALPAKNSQLAAFGRENAEKISGEYVKEHILVNDPTCYACSVACKKEVEIKEGPYKGLHMESLEYESAWALGANCDNSDVSTIAKLIDLCNDYGLDTIEMGNVQSMYMEATQRKYLNGYGPGLQWGDRPAMVDLIPKIALRDGVGDVLAEGTARAAEKLGHFELAMTVKGLAIPAYDPRGLKGMGLGYATSNRGACHLRAYTPASELSLIPLPTDPLAWEGKGKLTKIFQDLFAFMDSLDVCKFASFAEGAEEFAAQYRTFLGLDNFTAEDVMEAGERIYNLERHYNNLAGFVEGSDTLPKRFLEEPSTVPGSEGHVCELDKMLEEYYAERGWRDGVVPDVKLKELEII